MRRSRRSLAGRWPLLAGLALLAAASPSAADTIDGAEAATGRATTFLELMVGESEVRAELETGVPDLIAFEGVLPDDFRIRMGLSPEPEGERLRRFFAEELVLRADDGEPLPGRRIAFTTSWRWPRDTLTGERRPASDGGGMPVVVVGLVWDLDPSPGSLRLEPAMVGRTKRGATIALVTHHLGLPVAEATVLDGPVELELDRERPWRSRFTGAKPGRGLPRPLLVVLAVAAEEVRVEMAARRADFVRWLDLAPESEAGPADPMGVAGRIADRLADHLELRVDGERAEPVVARVDLLRRRLIEAGPEMPASADDRDVFVRAVLTRPAPEPPTAAELHWRLFPEELENVAGAVVDGSGATVETLTPESGTLRWVAPADRPAPRRVAAPPPSILRPAVWLLRAGVLVAGFMLVGSFARAAGGAASWRRVAALAALVAALIAGSLAAARAVSVDNRRAAVVVEPILHNLFLAGEIGDADRRAAAVGPWVADGLEAAVVETVRRPLELAGRGRDLTAVRGVELVEIDARREGRGFAARCRWRVGIGVSHWGHLHRRVDDRVAELTFEPVDGVWTLTGWSNLVAGAR